MVRFVRRRRIVRRKRRVPNVKRYYRRGIRGRAMYKKKFFTETFRASNLQANGDSTTSNPGQIWNATIQSIDQYAQYKALYQKYRIVKLTWMYIPDFGPAEPNAAEAIAAQNAMWDTNARMHFVKDYTQTTTPPANEIALLDNQGAKTVMFNSRTRPVRVTQTYPVTQDKLLNDAGGGVTSQIATTKNRWCSFDDSVSPAHGNILTYVQTRSLGAFGAIGQTVGSVYCKMTFECKDPR